MRCADVMTAAPETVGAADSVAQAVELLIRREILAVPVVDADGRYFGMFGAGDLASLVVPRMALAGNLAPNLRFVGADIGALTDRFEELKTRRVCDSADRNAPVLSADTPLMEAFRILCRSSQPLAVIDTRSRRLLGVVSCWDVMKAITTGA